MRGIDRTLEYAEYTEEERPVSIQIFGGDPEKMAAAAQIVEGMGADIVDINMGCPVAEDRQAQRRLQPDARARARRGIVGAMAKAVRIPVTVKMRAGWDATAINAPELAQGRGRRGRRGHGPRAHGGAVLHRLFRLGSDRRVAGG